MSRSIKVLEITNKSFVEFLYPEIYFLFSSNGKSHWRYITKKSLNIQNASKLLCNPFVRDGKLYIIYIDQDSNKFMSEVVFDIYGNPTILQTKQF